MNRKNEGRKGYRKIKLIRITPIFIYENVYKMLNIMCREIKKCFDVYRI